MRRPNGYWTEENTIRELATITEKLGRFPTQADLKSLKMTCVMKPMSQHPVAYWERKLGLEPRRNDYGYWNKWENLELEIRPHIVNGKFPNQKMLVIEIGSCVAMALAKFGGINKVAERMGCEPPSFFVTTDGHYVNSSNEYLFDEFLHSRGIKHDVNGRIHPSGNYRYDFKVGENFIEVWGYEPGRIDNKICQRYQEKREVKEKFYSSLDLKLISIESRIFSRPLAEIEQHFTELLGLLGYDTSLKEANFDIVNSAKHCRFWNEDKIVEELQKFVTDTGTFPSKLELEKTDAGLADAIGRHGGFNYFRNKMGTPILQRPAGFWTEDAIIAELKLIIADVGDFPTYENLKCLGKFDLIRGMNRNKGSVYYQKLLGFEPKKKSGDYWTPEVMLEELRKVRDYLGKKPTYAEARTANKTLISAIDRSKIGFKNLADKL